MLLRATLILYTSDCQIRGSQEQFSGFENEEHWNSQQLKNRQLFFLERGHAVVVIAFALKCCCCCCTEVLWLLFPSRGWVEKSRQQHLQLLLRCADSQGGWACALIILPHRRIRTMRGPQSVFVAQVRYTCCARVGPTEAFLMSDIQCQTQNPKLMDVASQAFSAAGGIPSRGLPQVFKVVLRAQLWASRATFDPLSPESA